MEDHTIDGVRRLADEELLKRTCELLGHSRSTEAALLAHLAEIDARRLYARFAVSCLFGYCTRVLHLSEHEAYLRITAARAARKHPVLLSMLADGRLHLTGIARLAVHLTAENCDRVLARATHRSMREVEELIAELAPLADAPPAIRKLPDRLRVADPSLPGVPLASASLPSPASRELVSKRVDVVQPTAPGRYKVQFTAGTSLRDKLERLRALMPDCDLPAAIEIAVTEKLARLEARRFGAGRTGRHGSGARTCQPCPSPSTTSRSASSRYLPAAVRRAVWERDAGRCRHLDERGRRCDATRRLEFHHRYPFGRGGG